MNILKRLPTIQYNARYYPFRYVNIFCGTDEECCIKVSTQTLGDAIIANNDENCYIDNLFACFVEESLLGKLTDAKLAKYIEDNYYN